MQLDLHQYHDVRIGILRPQYVHFCSSGLSYLTIPDNLISQIALMNIHSCIFLSLNYFGVNHRTKW